MWSTIALYGAALILIGGMIYALIRIYGGKKVAEIRRDIAEDEAERRAEHAVEAAKPMSHSPLSDLFVHDK